MTKTRYVPGKRSETVKLTRLTSRRITNNLTRVWDQSTPAERSAGLHAYPDYHRVMAEIAERYNVPHHLVCGVFCALSPNADWLSNLRSAITLVHGWVNDWPESGVTVTTYNANRARAWRIINGEPFTSVFSGLKVNDFYTSICDPTDPRAATIDAHLSNAARGQQNGVWYSGVSKTEYRKVRAAVQRLAKRNGRLPMQMQATIWFTWKRLHDILAVKEATLFEDCLRPYIDTRRILPYPQKWPAPCVECKQLELGL
jgi:hypothetical protein